MTLEQINSELVLVDAAISKLYANILNKRVEIQTANSRTVIEQADFQKVLSQLTARKRELEALRNNALGIQGSIVDKTLPPLALPVVFVGD